MNSWIKAAAGGGFQKIRFQEKCICIFQT